MRRLLKSKRQDFSQGEQPRFRMVTMNRILTTIALSGTVLAVMAGCGGRVKYPSYYTLDLPAPPDPPAAETAHATLAIREFRAPNYLREGAIVYKTTPEQISFYAYHRWAMDPRDFVTNAMIDRLRGSGIFAHVRAYDGNRDADYVLSGRLEKLEEIDYQGGVKVQVALSAEMTRLATGAIVWTNAVSEIGDVNKRDVPAVVSEMNRTMQHAIEKLLSSMPADVATVKTAREN
jgi:ABC-type uncharacterized transport system auxiliary subunit